jgi:hypothetical protein
LVSTDDGAVEGQLQPMARVNRIALTLGFQIGALNLRLAVHLMVMADRHD